MEYSIGSSRMNKKLFIALGIVIVILIAVAGFFFWQYTKLKSSPEVNSQETVQRLTKKVGALYALPTDEQPTVAEIKDKEKLKDQAFFKSAENGDYILIYQNAKTALLYREKDNKLINVGPIDLSSNKEEVKTNQ